MIGCYSSERGRSIACRAQPEAGSRLSKVGGGLFCEVLWQVLTVGLVSGCLLGSGRVWLASVAMWGLVAVFGTYWALVFRHERLACLLIALAPWLNILKGAALYTGVPVVFLGTACLMLFGKRRRPLVMSPPRMLSRCLLALALSYYTLSVVVTLNPRENIRVLELACPVVLVVEIASSRNLLRTAIAGFVCSALGVGFAAFPHIASENAHRLGIIATDELAIGNPFGLGTPLALGVLALSLDRGRWLGVDRRSVLRWLLLIPTVLLLALSTSRAGWLITSAGLLGGTVIAGRQRWRLVTAIAAVVAIGFLLSISPWAEPFERGWNRTFTKDRDASSGRADQWKVFYYAMFDSPQALWVGYGPGDNSWIFRRFSMEVQGIANPGGQAVFHGLFMHVGVALGLLGLITVLSWELLALRVSLVGFIRTKEAFPLMCFCGFVLGSLTVTGFDPNSGTLLGLGLGGFQGVSIKQRPVTGVGVGRIPGRW